MANSVELRRQKGREKLNEKSGHLLSIYKSFRLNPKEKKVDLFKRIMQKYPNLLEIDLKGQNNNSQYNHFLTELRELPTSIQEKKSLLQRLFKENNYRKSRNTTKSNAQNESNIGSIAYYYLIYGLKTFKTNILNFGKILASPLKNEIKKIETNYDRGIASYFSFSKWLIFANIFAFFLCLLPFLLAPHIVILSRNINKRNYSYCLDNPEKSLEFNLIDLIVANNTLKLAFYGCFENETYNLIPTAPTSYYNMQYAYLLVAIFYFFYWLIKTASSLAKAISHNFILTKVIQNKTVFVNILFNNWDYKLTKKIAVKEKMNQIHRELTSNLAIVRNQSKNDKTENRVLVHIATNFIYFIICGGIGVGIFYFSKELEKPEYFDTKNILLGVFICLLNYVLPNICKILAHFEKFKDKSTETKLSFFRVFFVQAVALGFTFGSSIVLNEESMERCYETTIGQLIYTIVIIDFLFFFFDCLIVAAKQLLFDRILKIFFPKYNRDFDIAYYTFNLLFSQALIWIGTYYSPFLTGLQIIKLLIIFFIEAQIVKTCYKPSRQIWPASKNTTFFLLISLIGFICVMSSVGYLNVTYPSSNNCGPFTNSTYAYDYLSKLRDEIENSSQTMSTILIILISPGLITFCLFILSVGVYGFYIAMTGHKESFRVLKALHQQQKQSRTVLQNKKKFYQAELNENINFDENEEMSDNKEFIDEEETEYEEENNDIVEDINETINEVDMSALKVKHVIPELETGEEDETNIDEEVVVKNQNKFEKKEKRRGEKSKIKNNKREDVDKIERVVERKKSKKDQNQVKF